jgi:hypothetical protein
MYFHDNVVIKFNFKYQFATIALTSTNYILADFFFATTRGSRSTERSKQQQLLHRYDKLLFIKFHPIQWYLTKCLICFLDDNDISNDSGSTTSRDQPLLIKDPKERKRQRERDHYAQLCDQQKDELLKRRRENHQHKKVTTDLMLEQIETRRANARARYANLKPEQRQVIRDRQRFLYANMTVEKKHAKRNHEKACCVIRRNTQSKKSIVMVNPLYDSSDSD